MQSLKNIVGSCHCENIRFDLQWPSIDAEILVRKCGCSFCVKHGGAWTSNRQSILTVKISDPSQVSKYQFGTGSADFHVCTKCGVVPLVVCDIDGMLYAVVNANTFENLGELSISTTPTNFDGEDTGSRLERRKRNWIPSVVFDESAT